MWDLCGLGSELAHCHIPLVVVVEASHKGFRGYMQPLTEGSQKQYKAGDKCSQQGMCRTRRTVPSCTGPQESSLEEVMLDEF